MDALATGDSIATCTFSASGRYFSAITEAGCYLVWDTTSYPSRVGIGDYGGRGVACICVFEAANRIVMGTNEGEVFVADIHGTLQERVATFRAPVIAIVNDSGEGACWIVTANGNVYDLDVGSDTMRVTPKFEGNAPWQASPSVEALGVGQGSLVCIDVELNAFEQHDLSQRRPATRRSLPMDWNDITLSADRSHLLVRTTSELYCWDILKAEWSLVLPEKTSTVGLYGRDEYVVADNSGSFGVIHASDGDTTLKSVIRTGNNPVAALACNTATRTCVSVDEWGRVRFWDIELDGDGRIHAFLPKPDRVVQGHDRRLTSLCVSPTGELVATSDNGGKVCVWSDSARGPVFSTTVGKRPRAMTFLDSQTLLVVCADSEIYVMDVKSNATTRRSFGKELTGVVTAILCLKDRHVILGTDRGEMLKLSLSDGLASLGATRLPSKPVVRSFLLMPKNEVLVVGDQCVFAIDEGGSVRSVFQAPESWEWELIGALDPHTFIVVARARDCIGVLSLDVGEGVGSIRKVFIDEVPIRQVSLTDSGGIVNILTSDIYMIDVRHPTGHVSYKNSHTIRMFACSPSGRTTILCSELGELAWIHVTRHQ